MKHPELLIPASKSGSIKNSGCVWCGCSIYRWKKPLELRAKAKNFSMEEIREGIAFAHAHDVKSIYYSKYSGS